MAHLDQFQRRALAFGAIASLFILAWYLKDVAIMVFGGVVISTALNAMAVALMRRTGLSHTLALTVVVFGLLAALVLLSLLLGPQVAQQIGALRTTLPQAIEAASRWLQTDSSLGMSLAEIWDLAKGGVPWESVASYASLATGGLLNVALIVILGLYLAGSPSFYFQGFLKLVPNDLRGRVAKALKASGQGLEKWLLGQMLSMLAVGTLTTIGLLLVGAPLALALGVLAGVLTFVPFFGPLAFTCLAVLFAFTDSPSRALYVGILCLVVQQLEGYVITPFIQRWAVALPPVLGLMAVVIFGLLFGALGILLATPMMVVLMILVETLYVEDDPEDAT
ncbi:AI-2E family transporter [Plastoroseomonas arctica]|uniref:AI-2E family transporter n=1 Tax=Plastoroseomonas arctica TaxID=1509237 RepID=A0AAF1KHZ0_9PROT|nr:AI-2E family transporter [Plastoroseomonas arctica]MBR0654494.1 AI-2E family transporter [Plastoroseomonas arctica]